jgi:hypothetical protein
MVSSKCMGKRRFFAAAVGVVCGVVAACVGDDPGATSSATDGGGSAADTSVDPPDTSTTPDTGVDAAVDDPKNCGAPGHDCFGGECVKGICQPVVIAEQQNRPLAIIADATHVYWVNGGSLNIAGNACDTAKLDGSIVRAKHDGTELVRIADGLACPSQWSIALGSDDYVYFGTTGDGSAGAGAIWRVKKDVAAGAVPTQVYGTLQNVRGLLMDGTSVYWGDESQGGRIMRGAFDAGAASVLAQGFATTPNTSLPRYLRLEGQNLYWITGYLNPQGVLRAAPKTANVDGGLDGGVTALDGPFRYLAAMTTTATHAYLAYGGDGQPEVIDSYALATGQKTRLFEGGGLVRAIAADATHVYVASRFQSVTRVSLATAKGERFVAIGDYCTGIAVDATSIFVTSTEAGKVRRIRKPAN